MDGEITLDPAIITALPAGCEITSIDQHGETNWSNGFKVTVEVDGEESEFFLKIITRELAAEMALGEYESQNALARYLPNNISHPVAQGTFQDDPTKAYFLTNFHHLRPRVITPPSLASILQQLHLNSVSPTGKFGFPVTTFKGYIPVDNSWCDTWEEWFTRLFRKEIPWEQSIRGEDPEFNEIAVEFFDKVIPRLLRPLQTGGRNIKPVLCHGDLWHGNIEFDVVTQDAILFDSCCVYGHNEFDLSLMKVPRYRLNTPHVEEYKKRMGVSEPVEDFDDRLLLYSMRNEIVVSGLWANWSHVRETVKQQMRDLIAKYPEGYAGFEATHGS